MRNLLKKFVKWVDPKLEKWREPAPAEPPAPEQYTPCDIVDLVGILERTPKEVLGYKARSVIAGAMSFNDKTVAEIMVPRAEMTFVYEHDFLGPLMLDKLYQSGLEHFPVLSTDGKRIVGLIETKALNKLEIKKTDRAGKFVDPTVFYLKDTYTLDQALAAFLRTNCFLFMVVDGTGELKGELSLADLVGFLLGYVPRDEFEDDTNLGAVIKR